MRIIPAWYKRTYISENMNMRSLFIAAAFVLLALCNDPVQAQDTLDFPRHQIKLSMLPLANLVDPALEFGYEWRRNAFSTEVIAGPALNTENNGLQQRGIKGYTITLEEKYFTGKTVGRWQPYVSARLRYYQRTMDELTTGVDAVGQVVADTFQVDRKTFGISVNGGLQLIKNNFVLQLSAGLGGKYVQVQHINRHYAFSSAREFFDFTWRSRQEQQRWILIMPFAIRLGYVF